MSDLHDKIEKIDAIEGKEGSEKIGRANEPVEGRFESLLDKPYDEVGALAEASQKIKPPTLEEVAKTTETQNASLSSNAKDIASQTKEIDTKIDAIKSDLRTENLEIKKPVYKLMQNRLTHIDEALRVALTKANITEKAPEVAPDRSNLLPNPAAEFFDHLTHSQDQLNNLGTYLDAVVNSEKELAPANMLAIQIKVNQIQQELEFLTNLLNKSLESTKALMNVQV